VVSSFNDYWELFGAKEVGISRSHLRVEIGNCPTQESHQRTNTLLGLAPAFPAVARVAALLGPCFLIRRSSGPGCAIHRLAPKMLLRSHGHNGLRQVVANSISFRCQVSRIRRADAVRVFKPLHPFADGDKLHLSSGTCMAQLPFFVSVPGALADHQLQTDAASN
jgi:hypothetical protein